MDFALVTYATFGRGGWPHSTITGSITTTRSAPRCSTWNVTGTCASAGAHRSVSADAAVDTSRTAREASARMGLDTFSIAGRSGGYVIREYAKLSSNSGRFRTGGA